MKIWLMSWLHNCASLDNGAQTAHDVAMKGASDDAHLSFAAQSNWTLVTHNVKDFVLLHSAWRRWSHDWGVNAHHPGILILYPPVSPQAADRHIEELLQTRQKLTDTLFSWHSQTGWVHQD